MRPLAYTADRPEEYARLGIARGAVAPWEDGMRTSGGPGGYEWWYFDCHLDDGTAMVVTFNTKQSLATWTGLRPSVSVELDRPGEPARRWAIEARPDEFQASTAHCDVRIGRCTFAGDLEDYTIHVENDEIAIDVTLHGDVPAWRPETGHFYFGEHRPKLFAWLPAVPQGTVHARIRVDGTTRELTGVGYHDHNWGDASMMRLMSRWYWGRAQAGPYSVIASWLFGAKRYRHAEVPIFLLAKDGRVVADDARRVRLRLEDVFADEPSGLPVANRVIYEYAGDSETYRVTFQREQTLLRTLPTDIDSWAIRAFVRLARIRGGYLRFAGPVTVERIVDGAVVESESDPGIWESPFFADPPGIARS